MIGSKRLGIESELRIGELSGAEIARKFGVSAAYISKIRHRHLGHMQVSPRLLTELLTEAEREWVRDEMRKHNVNAAELIALVIRDAMAEESDP